MDEGGGGGEGRMKYVRKGVALRILDSLEESRGGENSRQGVVVGGVKIINIQLDFFSSFFYFFFFFQPTLFNIRYGSSRYIRSTRALTGGGSRVIQFSSRKTSGTMNN